MPTTTPTSRVPTEFAPHGGGPWPVMALRGMPAAEQRPLADYMKSIADVVPAPTALLVVSAHWEAPVVTVNTGSSPPMLYDYGGFPDEAYRLQWPAPGNPALGAEVLDLLAKAGFAAAQDDTRGFDHGTFIPLMLAYPDPSIPVVQVSLKQGLDPAEHVAMGQALAPLRDRGAYIIGSGNSFHNLPGFFPAGPSGPTRRSRPAKPGSAFFNKSPGLAEASRAFDTWLRETIALPAAERNARLERWTEAPDARTCHPREEHLLPLMVVAGAAGDDAGRVRWTGTMGEMTISAHRFA